MLALVGALGLAFVFARIVSIVAYDGARVPGMGMSIFTGSFLLVLLSWSVSRLLNRNQAQGQSSLNQMRQKYSFDMKQATPFLATVLIAVVVGTVLFTNMNIHLGNTDKAWMKLTEKSKAQDRFTRQIESFLRK